MIKFEMSEIKFERKLRVQLKAIRRIGNKMKFFRSQIKNPNF
jgi:hypothetical protein